MSGERRDERFHFSASKSWLDTVDEWARQHRVKTRAEAVRVLVERGMQIVENDDDGAKLPGTPRHRPHAGKDRPVSTEL